MVLPLLLLPIGLTVVQRLASRDLVACILPFLGRASSATWAASLFLAKYTISRRGAQGQWWRVLKNTFND